MKAGIATGFGSPETGNIFVKSDWPVPELPKEKDDYMLIRVLACALAPGDVRVLSGKTDYVQLPEGGHPYVVGSDTSGVVVAIGPDEKKFQLGDYVVARFDEPKPNGGVAEYRLVKTSLSEKCPASISPIVACGLPASAMAAKHVVRLYQHEGDRVLVIGGSSAVGTSIIQYAKIAKAAYVVAVSTQRELCESLGADQVVDYREQKWWEVPEFQQNRFDIVYDLVNGENWIKGGCSGNAINRKGTYVALLSGVETEIEVHGSFDMVRFGFEFIGRILYSRLHPFVPKWVAPEALELHDGDLRELLDDVEQNRFKPILDPSSPFDFTEADLRKAFQLQNSRHAHGKVVILIAEK